MVRSGSPPFYWIMRFPPFCVVNIFEFHHQFGLLCGLAEALVVNFCDFHHRNCQLNRVKGLAVVNFTTDKAGKPNKAAEWW